MTFKTIEQNGKFFDKHVIQRVADKLLRGFTFESMSTMQAAFRSFGFDPLPDRVREVRVVILKSLMRDWQIKHEELK